MIEPAPKTEPIPVASASPEVKTAGNAPATATGTEEWPFEWLPFGMQE